MIAYVDASVLLRVALGEPGHLPEWAQVDAAISSELLGAECRRTLHRHRLAARLRDEDFVDAIEALQALLAKISLVAIDASVLSRAGDAFPTNVGTLEAIHLATALLWTEKPLDAFLTHDLELGRAARAMGLRVLGC